MQHPAGLARLPAETGSGEEEPLPSLPLLLWQDEHVNQHDDTVRRQHPCKSPPTSDMCSAANLGLLGTMETRHMRGCVFDFSRLGRTWHTMAAVVFHCNYATNTLHVQACVISLWHRMFLQSNSQAFLICWTRLLNFIKAISYLIQPTLVMSYKHCWQLQIRSAQCSWGSLDHSSYPFWCLAKLGDSFSPWFW